MSSPRWSLAIFSSREALETLTETVKAAVQAAPDALIDVLVNGNPALAEGLAARLASMPDAVPNRRLRVWSIACGDKAHAWNEYVHRLWPGSDVAFFLDGYVRLKADAIDLLGNGVLASPEAIAGSGVPTSGRSASTLRRRMITDSGFHGNLCCIRNTAMQALRSRDIRLPLGLYRTDATMGAILSFGMDPSQNAWTPQKYVFVHPDATWKNDEKRWWRLSDIQSMVKRRLRQAQGNFENRAVRDHLAIRKQAPESFPSTVRELIVNWARNCPEDVQRLTRISLLSRMGLARLHETRDWSSAGVPPRCLHCGSEAGQAPDLTQGK